MSIKRATVLATVVTLFAVCAVAQDRALISGDSEDQQDTPVSGVRITLRNESLRVERTTTTNSDGLYFFAEVVPAEGYVMTATAPGMDLLAAEREIRCRSRGDTARTSIIRGRQSCGASVEIAATEPVGFRRSNVSRRTRRVAIIAHFEIHSVDCPTADILATSCLHTWTFWSIRHGVWRRWRRFSRAQGEFRSIFAPGRAAEPANRSNGRFRQAFAVASARNRWSHLSVPLDTMSTAVSTVITGNQLRNLPLFNRNFLAVGLLDFQHPRCAGVVGTERYDLQHLRPAAHVECLPARRNGQCGVEQQSGHSVSSQ